jgi:hypothetical protein
VQVEVQWNHFEAIKATCKMEDSMRMEYPVLFFV